MQKKILLFLGFITQLFTINAVAQKNTSNKQVKVEQVKSLLWKISGGGLSKPSYVLGTIHAICADDYFFTNKMKEAFRESQRLILEVNIDDAATQAQMQEQLIPQDGRTLRDYFAGEEEYGNFQLHVKEQHGIDIESFSNLKPFALISALSLQNLKCNMPASYEVNLIAQSKEINMAIIGLESIQAQVKIFDDMPTETIKAMLKQSTSNDDGSNSMEKEMVQLYKNQDIQGLYNMILQSKEIAGQENAMLFDRNSNWAKQLPELMKQSPSFIAVGAGHLSGEKGLLNLLKQYGYKVEPML